MFLDAVTGAVFLLFCLAAYLVVNYFRAGRKRADGLVNENERSVGAYARAMAKVVPQPGIEVEKIERDLKRAGYYAHTALVEYMASRNTLVVAVLIATGILAVLADPTTAMPRTIAIVGLLTATLGYAIPRMVLNLQARARVDRIQRGLPDALDIIRMCLSGGLPLRESIQRVASEIGMFHPDIALELQVIQHHADTNSMPDALKKFARRIDTPDINALASLVSQSDQVGTNVASAVAEYADGIRRQHRQRAEETASKTSISLLFPVIFCLAPPIYVLLCGPPLLQMRDFITEGNQPGGVLDNSSLDELSTGAVGR
ncbi:MAG: type II secretion system F family protein [Planctomycetota bacterium]|nr:type II secretion system F family protein [Planctomycetota bacterium]MDA1163203.1 type II secretion system F family protein [Planctomycetota bacterium]